MDRSCTRPRRPSRIRSSRRLLPRPRGRPGRTRDLAHALPPADGRQPRRRAAARAPGRRRSRGAAGLDATARPELRQGAKDANYGYSPHRGHPEEPTRLSDPTGGGDVELLQLKLYRHLNAMRRLGLIVDGDFGGATARAVIAFKRFHNIRPANAVVDAATWTALDQTPPIVAPRGRGCPRPAPGVRPHHGGRADADHARGRLRRDGLTPAEHHELERGLTEVRASRSTRTARPSCTRRPGARRRPRAASCTSRRTSPRRTAAPCTACCA